MKLKQYKRWIAAMLTITLVMMVFCTTINVNATDVTVANTFGDATVDYTSSDYLTSSNYVDNYDDVDGYLKYCTNYYAFLNNTDADFGTNSINTVLGNINNLNQTEFPDVEGKKISLYVWWRSTYSCYLYNMVVDGTDDIFLVNGYLCSKSQFTIKQYIYSCGSGTISGNYTRYTGEGFGYNIIDDTPNIQYDATNGFYYRNFGGMLFYSEVPVYLTFNQNNSYSDGDYLGQSPYNYQTWSNIAKTVIDNTDNTGFVIDRRTEHMIEETSGGGSSGTLGTLSGSFHHLYGGTSLQDSKLLTMYQLNSYADSNRYNVYLNYNYKFDMSGVYNTIPLDFHADYYSINGNFDSYLIGSSNYLAIDMNKAFEKMTITNLSDEDGVVDALAQIRSTYNGKRPYYVAVNPIDCFDVLSQAGFSTYSTYDVSRTELLTQDYGNDLLNFSSSLVDDLRSWIFGKPYETQTSISSGVANTTTLCKLTITTFLSYGDETSSTAIYTYDFLNGSWSSEGSMDYDGDQTFDGYDYKNPNSDVNDYNNAIVPSDYYSSGGYIQTTGGNGYGGSASIGNITIGAGETIVDLSTDEWLQHSPNYNDLITTLKNGITAVSEDSGSVTALLTETYTVFPVPIWGYLTLAIATISALAVIRYIRRG